MDYNQQLMYEFQMKKKKQLKNKRKNKRNLKKAIEISHQQQTELVEGYYEVESIEKIKSFGKYDLRFYIKWKGWNDEDNTWEPFQNVRNCYFNLREFYERGLENKKITNSDAWKMYIGCLQREKLIDDQGKFKDSIKRKYTKRRKENDDSNSSEIQDGPTKKSKKHDEDDEDSDDYNDSDLELKQKIKKEDAEMDREESDDEKMQEENIPVKKRYTKKKKLEQEESENGERSKKDKEDIDGVKKKRKYRTKRYLEELERKKEEISSKGRKLKRTHSTILTKRQRKPKGIISSKLQEDKQINPILADIEPKIEEGEENNENGFNQLGGNSQNRIVSSNQIENNNNNNNTSQGNATPNEAKEQAKQTDRVMSKEQLSDIENKDINMQGSKEQLESQKQLNDINSKSILVQNGISHNDDNSDSSDEEDDEDDDEDDDDEEEDDEDEQNSSNLKARGFSTLQVENGNELEPKITKKRKNEINVLNSQENLTENKQQQMLNSLQELDLVQQEGQFNQRILNGENNAFGSHNNITSGILGNPDINAVNNLNLRKKRRMHEILTEEGSISGGKNHQIHSFDNHNHQDQILSEQFLDKMNGHNESQLSHHTSKSFLFGNDRSTTMRSQNYSHNKLTNSIYWNDTQIEDTYNIYPPDLLQPQSLYQSTYNQLNNTQHGLTNKQQMDLYKQSKTITIIDDEDEDNNDEDIQENSELQYKLHNEKDDKDKYTKIRLVKKHDSVEIQDAQPYKHHNQYKDELQNKKVRSCNYNDSQGQVGGQSKSLQELNKLNQPDLKQQYYKLKNQLTTSNNGKNGLQKQNSNIQNGAQNNIPQFNDQTYEQFIISQFQEIKHLKNPEIKDPQKSIVSLYEGNLSLKDEPNRIIAMDIHPYLIGQYIFKVTWAPRKKKDQLISSWVEGDKLKLKYPNLVIEFYESFIRFVD